MSNHHVSSGTQLSLFNIEIKQVASLDDFLADSFIPIKKIIHEFIYHTINELYIHGNDGSGKTHLLTAIYHTYIKHNPNAICYLGFIGGGSVLFLVFMMINASV